MATDDGLKRYLDIGVALTQSLGATAEGLVKELIKTGEAQREQVDDMFERGRRGTEVLVELMRREVSAQLHQLVSDLGLVTRADLEDLEGRLRAELASAPRRSTAPRSRPAGEGGAAARRSAAGAARTATAENAAKRTAKKAAPATAAAKRQAPRPGGTAKKAPARRRGA